MDSAKEEKKIIVLGATGSLAKFLIEASKDLEDTQLTLFVRDQSKISAELAEGHKVIQGDALKYEDLQNAIAGQDIVCVNLAGDLETMSKNIVKAMQEKRVKRIIAISSIGIYDQPIRSVLIPYRKLADIIEASGLDYTILRPEWFTYEDEIDYLITQKGDPEKGTAVSRKSIASFIKTIFINPELHKNTNLGISKPN